MCTARGLRSNCELPVALKKVIVCLACPWVNTFYHSPNQCSFVGSTSLVLQLVSPTFSLNHYPKWHPTPRAQPQRPPSCAQLRHQWQTRSRPKRFLRLSARVRRGSGVGLLHTVAETGSNFHHTALQLLPLRLCVVESRKCRRRFARTRKGELPYICTQ